MAGLEQDLVLLEQPPPVSDYDMADDPALRLELITEFLEAPQPAITETVLKSETDPLVRAQTGQQAAGTGRVKRTLVASLDQLLAKVTPIACAMPMMVAQSRRREAANQ